MKIGIPLPPNHLRGTSDGHGDPLYSVAQSYEFLGYFRELCGLTHDSKVLDVGCGVGRMARGLTACLSGGEYHGFDAVKEQIAWCSEHITPLYPNFHFQHIDVANGTYNGEGAVSAEALEFPYDANMFDLVFLASVFTHMLPKAMENYLGEIGRVLKPGGRCLITWFLLTDERIKNIGRAAFAIDKGGEDGIYRVADQAHPEHVVGFIEQYVRSAYRKSGLKIVDPVRYGFWGGTPGISGQDIIVAEK
ncbi:SAM-dependent methyltransferase [Bradyrhizobium sp. GM6.1]